MGNKWNELSEEASGQDKAVGAATSFPLPDPRWQGDLDYHDAKSDKNNAKRTIHMTNV